MIQDIAKTQVALDVLGIPKKIQDLQKSASAVYISNGGGGGGGLTQATADTLYVLKAGDTMTGVLNFGDQIYSHSSLSTELFTTNIPIIKFGTDTSFAYDGTEGGLFWSNPDSDNGRVELRTTGGTYLNFAAGTIEATTLYASSSMGAANLTSTGVVFSSGTFLATDVTNFFYTAGTNLLNLTQTALETTSTPSLRLENTTAATAGVPVQYSPAIDLIGHGLIALGSADRTIRFRTEVVPTSGTPIGTLTWSSSVDTGTASYTPRMTLTSAGALSVASVTATGQTAGRVVYTGAGGLLSSNTTFNYDGTNAALGTTIVSGSRLIIRGSGATNSTTGLLVENSSGTDTLLVRDDGYVRFPTATAVAVRTTFGATAGIYERTALSGSGSTLVNATIDVAGGNFRVSGATHRSSSASESALLVSKTFTPADSSTGRMWALNFIANFQGSNNSTDPTSGIVGVEGAITNTSTATLSAMSGMILFNTLGAASTTTRFAGADYYGADVSGSGGVGATVTEAAGVIIRMGRSSGNTSLGNITSLWGVQLRPSTWSGTGHMTSQFGLAYNTGGTMNSITANGQVRKFVEVPAMPSPGAFTGLTNYGIDFVGASRTTRDGIRFALDDEAIIYSGAADRIDVTGGFEAVTDVRGRQFIADGDNAGVASTTSLTNTTDSLGESTVGIEQRAGNASSVHSGYIKMYVGTTAVYVPYYN
jgi:hypothetical protein